MSALPREGFSGRASWSQARPAQGVDLLSARKQDIQAGWPRPDSSICSWTTSTEAVGGDSPGCRTHTGAVQAAPGWPPAAATPGHPSMLWDKSKRSGWGNLLSHPRARQPPGWGCEGGRLHGGKCREQNSRGRGDQFWGDQGWRETLAARGPQKLTPRPTHSFGVADSCHWAAGLSVLFQEEALLRPALGTSLTIPGRLAWLVVGLILSHQPKELGVSCSSVGSGEH